VLLDFSCPMAAGTSSWPAMDGDLTVLN
jgi:hypothetical protein